MLKFVYRHDVPAAFMVLAIVLILEMALRAMRWGAEQVVLALSVADLLEFVAAIGLVAWLLWRYWYFLPQFYRFGTRYPGLGSSWC